VRSRRPASIRPLPAVALTAASAVVLAVVLAVVGATVAIVVSAAPASAHARQERTEPVSGSRLDASPARVAVVFDEAVEAGTSALSLVDAAGAARALGPVGRADDLGVDADRVVVADVTEALGTGTYVVVWRVTSADGHPAQGAFTFSVGAVPPADVDGLVATLLAAQGNDAVVGALAALARWVSLSGLVVALGALAVTGHLVGPGAAAVPGATGGHPVAARLRRVVVGAAAAGAGASLLLVGLQVPLGSGGGIADALDPAGWADVVATRAGQGLVVRALVGVAAALVASVAPRRGWAAAAVGRCGAVLLGVAALAMALGGHGATGPAPVVGAVVTVAHVAAAGVWLGGVAVLVVVARGDAADAAVGAARRFSPLALGAVVVVAVGGLAQGVRQVGSPGALLDTPYGRLVVVKALGLAAVVVVARWSRSLVRTPAVAAGAVRGALRRTLAVEAALAIGVLGATALLSGAVPARIDTRAPYSATIVEGSLIADLWVTPGRVGTNELHVVVTSTGGSLDAVGELRVRVRNTDAGIATIEVPVETVGRGHVTTDALQLPAPGLWELEVVAASATGQTRFTTRFRVG
jgi:copper transport protein